MPAAPSSLIDPAIGQLLAAAQVLDEERAGGCCRCWLRSLTRGRAAGCVTGWR